MLLLADSGSSKTAWALLDINKKTIVTKCETIGFNPFHHSETEILEAIKQNNQLILYANHITNIHYFGAGCSSLERCEQMKNILQKFFFQAKIYVKSDLWAAVLATCGRQKGIVCILGTGSNACFFDGKNITQHTPALGYILGDEGSGSYLGKQLLASFLYKKLPANLQMLFEKKYNLHKENVLNEVYNGTNPKKYLAHFTHFLDENKENNYIKKLIINSFTHFLDIHIKFYLQNSKLLPVHFIGSIAYHFQDILVEVLQENNIQAGKILKQPLDELIEHYLNNSI
ncbi:MAG: hypothetical protein ACPG5B_07850 [Chitinophagales bacterium]